MKVLIEIDETLIDKTIWFDVNNLDTEELENMRYAIANGTPLNGTNGEVLCMLFPNMHYTLSDKSPRVVTTIGVASSFDIDWWSAPYKAESEE